MAHYTHEYFITDGANDGYVNHDLSFFDDYDYSLLLYWNIWDENGFCDWYIAFNSINIPKGSRILQANLRMNVYIVENGYVESELRASLENNIPTSYAEFIAMVGTDEYFNIHLDPQAEEQIINYDITEIIQAKINQQDWVEGNNIILFTSNTNGETIDSGSDWDTYEYNPVTQLTIVFEPPETISLTDILINSRIESFEYERLTLQAGKYKHFEYITNKVQDGSIKIDFTRDIIGSATFLMKEYNDINYLSDLIRPWYIVNYLGVEYKFPLGTFMLISPSKDSNGMLIERNIQGYDLLYALEQDKTTESTYYAAGTNVTDTIKAILDDVGTWVNYIIPDSDEELIEDMTYEIGRSKLFVINSLLNTINYYPLWCSGDGIYKSIPWSDKKFASWTFQDDNGSLYESGIKVNVDYSQIYNKVIVIAQQLTADTDPLVKIWTFEDEGLSDHPLSYTSLGRYIVKRFDSEAVSQDYVDLRARRELLKMLEIEESILYNHAFISGRFNDGLPYQGDCYVFINELLELNATYKIDVISWNLKTGNLVNSLIRRVTSV